MLDNDVVCVQKMLKELQAKGHATKLRSNYIGAVSSISRKCQQTAIGSKIRACSLIASGDCRKGGAPDGY